MGIMGLGRDVTAVEMMQLVVRAKMTEKSATQEEIISYVRSLSPVELTMAYHQAAAVLDRKQLLTRQERLELKEYAQDYLRAV